MWMAKKTRKRLAQSKPWATLNVARPSSQAVEHHFQDFRETAETLVETHNIATADCPFIEPLDANEVCEILSTQIMPELTNELLNLGRYGQGLLIGTVMFLMYENSKEDEHHEEEAEPPV
jgi:hypothetical protein